MATFKSIAANHRFFVRKPEMSPQLEGFEGKELSQKISEVSQAIQRDEPIQRLLKAYKEGNEKRHQELRCYLDALQIQAKSTGEAEFTILVLDTAWQVWLVVREYFFLQDLCLEVPDACPGQRDNFMYTWSKAEYYLECEIFSSGEVEFFYRNRDSGEVWGEDTTLEQGFSTTIFDKAALFTW